MLLRGEGNGDILDVEDAATMFAETGCDGISIGRGALTNPWIFRQLMQWERTGHWDSTPLTTEISAGLRLHATSQ